MSNALTPSTVVSGSSLVPERFANPLRQIQDMLAQPAVRRSLPMILLIGLVAAAAGAWMMLATPTQKTLFSGLPDADKSAVTTALTAANIKSRIDEGTGALTVGEDDYSRARILLAGQGLPKAAPGGYAILDQLPMGVSRAVEGERLRQARETELARSIQEIDAVAEARVHLATPEASVFVRDNAAPSASVIVKLQPGRSLGDAQVSSIINLVASSVPGMKPDAVTIVDQMGGLLTKGSDQSAQGAAGDERIRFQRTVEEKYRAQVMQLLTPLVGAGNFTTEIQADVDLDETQATRESYDKQGALRAEQGQWAKAGADEAAPGGIPGALSNTPPPASTLSVPKPTPTPTPGATPAAGTTPAPGSTAGVVQAAGAAVSDAMKSTDQYARAYDLGKEVSVTRAAPGAIKRLSVAVLLRDPDTGKPRSPVEIQQITQLVRTAVGADAARNDQIVVVSRKFAGATALENKGPPWYESGWVPVVARNATAIVIALLVLFLGVRPLAKAILKKSSDTQVEQRIAARRSTRRQATEGDEMVEDDGEGGQVRSVRPPAPPVTIAEIEDARDFEDRIDMVRGFTRDNPARAALAVRDMIKADAKS
ncbi:flagellar basal-body MS-ring/collar protein FliF [Sphingomonas immobilis]|uniref:Flagellar M-ring protein n=1 Tax=Sphingomonas immobilis TaxID=3063997 RepID=A0ABT8ZW92_9SPHN|nr:flagellar basal-body MS-ring/collar protein FliF [Sphingomonas sp. CA1-15]MDO7841487.1 flagellar basal-body MS-ring/collar protein FliF [Sphingomonas sp. CA1-15]